MKKRRGTRRKLRLERLDARRVLAAISGVVFEDVDSSFQREKDESGLANRLVYLDADGGGTFNAGEAYALTDADGAFEFAGLADGRYTVRLHDGNASQAQIFPLETDATSLQPNIAGATGVIHQDNRLVGIDGREIFVADLIDGRISRTGNDGLPVDGFTPVSLTAIADNRLLVVGEGDEDGSLWLVDPSADQWQRLDVTGGDAAPDQLTSTQTRNWRDVAVDGAGRGLAIATVATEGLPANETLIHGVDAVDPNAIELTSTNFVVAPDARLITSDSGPRSVLVTPSSDGLLAQLWSNETASPISSSSFLIAGTSDLVDFDDASGLLVLRDAAGGVTVADANNNFAPLFRFNELLGPLRLDATRELLWAVSPLEGTLKILELGGGTQIAEVSLDTGSVGAIRSVLPGRILPDSGIDSLAVVGAAGIAEVRLESPAAHDLVLAGDTTANVTFALKLTGTNRAPFYQSLPDLETSEDQAFSRPPPTLLQDAVDDDGDQILILQTGPAGNATATASPDGGLFYQPDADFAGTDGIPILLHDGRDVTSVTIPVSVTPVPDDPTAVVVSVSPFPETIPVGTVIGTIEVIDVDGGGHRILIDHPWFDDDNGNLIFIGGDLDFENPEPVELTVTAIDAETEAALTERVRLTLLDGNDPITDIQHGPAFVNENSPGDVIVELFVIDQDPEQFYVFTVDDERFIVDENQLRLADGVSLDYEAEDQVTVNVTAIDEANNDRFTKAIVIRVGDVLEIPTSLTLGGDTVLEFTPGASVGDVEVDGVPRPNGYSFGVDDPSFEIVDGRLKLVDGQWVVREEAAEIRLQITAQIDGNSSIDPLIGNFTIAVLPNDQPFHNENLPEDVDGTGDVTSHDALLIINYLNLHGPGPVGDGDPFGYDVNGDGLVTALDVLLVLNTLNRQDMNARGQAEGETAPSPQAPSPQAPQQLAPNRYARRSDATDRPNEVATFASEPTAVTGPDPPGDRSDVVDQAGIVDWVLRQRDSDDATEVEIDKFLTLLSQRDGSA